MEKKKTKVERLVAQIVKLWDSRVEYTERLGQLIVEVLKADRQAFHKVCVANPQITMTALNELHRVGTGKLDARLFGRPEKHLQLLGRCSIAEQRLILDGTVAVVTSTTGNTKKISATEFFKSAATASILIDPVNVRFRTPEAQLTYLKKQGSVAAGRPKYSFKGKTIRFSRNAQFSLPELRAVVAEFQTFLRTNRK